MKEFVAEKIKAMKPSGIREFFDIASTIEDCISLGVGEPDFDTPKQVAEAGIRSLEEGKTFYTSNQGLLELRKEICAWNKRKYGLDYEPENVIITCGGSEAIDISLRAIINAGDEVIVLDPSYVSYAPCVVMAGGVVNTIRLKNENSFKLTAEELESAITPKTKAIILNYPNNPTGAIMRKEDYEKIVDIIIKNDLFVISDEIYSELTYGRNHCSIASFPNMKQRCVVINGFSKAFSMTGWRLGYVMGPSEVMKNMLKIHQFVIMCSPTVSQYAGLKALRNADKDVENMRDEYNKRRQFLLKEFAKLGLSCFEPEGAFYCFPSISSFKMSSMDFAKSLLKKQRVVVVPGTAFGDCGEGFVRVSYASSIEELQEAIKRIKAFIDQL